MKHCHLTPLIPLALTLALIVSSGAGTPATAMPNVAEPAQTRIFHQTNPVPAAPSGSTDRTVPFTCRVQGTVSGRDYVGYQQGCMLRLVEDAYRLPDACLFTIETTRGPFRYFGARCMRNRGWDIGQRID